MKKSTIIAATAALLAVPATFSGAYAHVGLEKSEANSGSFYKAVLRIPHGCDDKATTEVRVTLPEGFISAQPQPKAGWTIDTVKGDYAQSYKVHGKDVTSGVTEVRWSAGNLPSDFYDEFVVVGTLAKFDKDTTLSFPTTQLCGTDSSIVWSDIAADGQNPHDLKSPAPQLLVKVADSTDEHAHHGHTEAAAITVGDLIISDPTIRATIPGASVGGGYLTIVNNGTEADRLISVTSPSANHVEIHEMSMENQVMKMRHLKDGLVIPAGETVRLKPGSYHLMLMKPVQPYVEDATIPATLEFEKAGKIDIQFNVTSATGKAPAHEHH